jgi:hypothetical protein
MLFSTKIRVVWSLIINQRLVHITPHMVPCHRSHSWICGGDHFLVKNPLLLAFGIIFDKNGGCVANTTPIFVQNSNERPFSIIPKANTYRFLTKKWSPLEIQECDLWKGIICGVRCTSLSLMINDHTTPIFVENSHERPFLMTLKANTYRFLTKKWSPP